MSASRMIRPFIPPTIAALRPVLALESSDRESDGGREPACKAGFTEGHACGLLEGRLAGQREGEARAREAFDTDRDALLEKLAKLQEAETVWAALDRLLARRDEAERALEEAARSVLVSALRTLFPILLDSAAGAEISALVRGALAVRARGAIGLRANPATLADLANAAPDGLTLTSDAALAPGAAELSWSGGGLSFDPAALLERMAALLSPARPATPGGSDNKDTMP